MQFMCLLLGEVLFKVWVKKKPPKSITVICFFSFISELENSFNSTACF